MRVKVASVLCVNKKRHTIISLIIFYEACKAKGQRQGKGKGEQAEGKGKGKSQTTLQGSTQSHCRFHRERCMHAMMPSPPSCLTCAWSERGRRRREGLGNVACLFAARTGKSARVAWGIPAIAAQRTIGRLYAAVSYVPQTRVQ